MARRASRRGRRRRWKRGKWRHARPGRPPPAVAAQLAKGPLQTAALGAGPRFNAKGDADLPAFEVLVCRAGTEPTLTAACRAEAPAK